MNMGRLTLKVFLLTITCFLLSYASSVLGNLNAEKSFPHSLFTQYTKTIGSTQAVEIQKSIESNDISEIEIQTTQTDVEIKSADTKPDAGQIQIGLRGHYVSQTNHPENALQVSSEGSKLFIKTNEGDSDDHAFFHISSQDSDGKMIIIVPMSIKKVKINVVSGDVSLSQMKLSELSIVSVSGDSLLSQTSADLLQFKSVSGGLAGTGTFAQFSAKTVSGGAKINFLNTNPVIEFKSTSGDMQSSFSTTPDLTVQFSSISGSFNVDPSFSPDNKENRKVQMSLGTGIGKAMINTISGDFKIGRTEKIE